MIPMFFGDAVEVTPEVEDIVLAVMRVGADGTIRPHLARANHLRILRAIWQQDPPALHARLRTPALAILARGGDRVVGRATPRCGCRAARGGLPDAHGLDGRDPRPAAAAPPRAGPADRSLRANRRTIDACSCSSSS